MQFLTCNLDTVGKKNKIKIKRIEKQLRKKKKKTQEKQLLKK